jgi:amino acid permease
MSSLGGYLRGFLGFFLSLEILRYAIFGGTLFWAGLMSVVYIILFACYFIIRF